MLHCVPAAYASAMANLLLLTANACKQHLLILSVNKSVAGYVDISNISYILYIPSASRRFVTAVLGVYACDGMWRVTSTISLWLHHFTK